jgi:toxin secretion/phage lysis holin
MATFKTIMTSLGAIIGYYLGGFDMLLKALLILVLVDYVSGMMASGIEGKLRSNIGFKGIARKVMLFLIVVCGSLMDHSLNTGDTFRNATIFFYISNELLSILENAGRIGIPIPEKLKQTIEILKTKEGEK